MTMQPTTEQPLVANPNCVAFATEAGRLFDGRSWADLQQLASGIVLPFHQRTGLPSLAGYAWRVALTRRNDRVLQGMMYVALDGPATADHLDSLEHSVADLGLGFGPASVERVPINGAHAVIATDGRVAGIWSRDAGAAMPWIRRIQRDDEGKVHAIVGRPAELGPKDYCRDMAQVIGVPPPYGEEERETERMRLAFALKFTRRIIEADGVVRDREAEFVDTVFPADLIRRLGLDEEAAQKEYFDAAAEHLRLQLGHHDKLALIGLFFSACFSDGSLDAREMRVLKDAGEALGLTREQVVKYLRRFW